MADPLNSINGAILQYLFMADKGIHVGRIVTFYGMLHKGARRVALSSMPFLLITGCSQHGINGEIARSSKSVPYAIVSSGFPEDTISSRSTFRWATDMRAGNTSPMLGGVPVNSIIEAAIGKTMAAKGYRFAGAGVAQGISVAYHVALGNSEKAGQTDSHYGMHPGLAMTAPDAQQYEKGTLVVIVFDDMTGRQAWRSTLQGFSDLDIPADVRQQRINDIIGNMFEGFPRREVNND